MSEKKKAENAAENTETAANVETASANCEVSGEDLVEYSAPLIGMEKRRDILVSVNGETIRIQRGQTVRIKRKFQEALNNAARQEYNAYVAADKAAAQSKKALMDL